MSTTLQEATPSLLSERSAAVVAATAGVVAAHAEQITARFYPRMFAEHPELLRVFNQGNQATGEQSRALAASVVAYAVHLIDPEAPPFDRVLERIAYKHISLGIRPEQYTIVGYHLLGAVGEVLGDAVTPAIADAWNEVYWLFATQLVAEEARLYQQAGVDPARPLRPYRVVRKIEETQDVISLILEPADGGDLPEISAPPGDFVVQSSNGPLLLASAGAGITTVLPIVEHIARTQPNRTVIVAHADRTAQDHALRDTVLHVGRQLDDFTAYTWYETVGSDDHRSHQGLMDLSEIPLPADVQVFTCGPLPFMRHIRSTLLARDVPAASIRYEVFGPDLWASQMPEEPTDS